MKKIQTTRLGKYRPPSNNGGHNTAVSAALVILAISLVLVGGGFLVRQGLAHSDFFQLTAIDIEGCCRLDKNKVLELSGVDVQANLIVVPVDAVRERIESHDWIAKANVKRHWPNRLQIVVTERKPAALVNLPSGLHFVDVDGVAFAAAVPPEDLDFPVISGLPEKIVPGSETHKAMLAALKFIDYSAGGNLVLPRQNISELCITADNELILLLVDRPFPIYLGKERLKSKYFQLVKVLQWLYANKKFATTESVRMNNQKDKVLVTSTIAG